jgi:hypothetical protein
MKSEQPPKNKKALKLIKAFVFGLVLLGLVSGLVIAGQRI